LRVLSDGHFYRVGGHSAVKTNVRVIAATHQNLEQRVKDGAFREDLFHRLNVIRLRLPALRERREDVPLLVRFFLQQSAKQLNVEPKRISDDAMRALCAFDFPGNVRQLENICHWLTVMAPAQLVDLKDLPPEVALSTVGPGAMVAVEHAVSSPNAGHAGIGQPNLAVVQAVATSVPMSGNHLLTGALPSWELGLHQEALALLAQERTDVWDVLTARFESALIQAALSTTRGRRIEAAHKLGIGRNTITRKIQELGMENI
jgi:two-component system nitrogen regulation response regulator GlnG